MARVPIPFFGGPNTVSFTRQPAAGVQTLDALMARQKELARRQADLSAGGYPGEGTIVGGLGNMANQLFAGIGQNRARQEEATGRQELAQAISGVNWDTGEAAPETVQTIFGRDPDTGLAVIQALAESRRAQREATALQRQREQERGWTVEDREDAQAAAAELARQKAETDAKVATGPKLSDIATIRQDFISDPSVKAFKNAEPMWNSMQDAVTRDTPQADLNMIIAMAKMFDPTSVVRTEEGEMVRQTGDLPSTIYSQWSYLTGAPGARLAPEVRQGMMQEAYSRMKGYYDAYKGTSQHYTSLAGRWGVNPADVVEPLPEPQPWAAPAADDGIVKIERID